MFPGQHDAERNPDVHKMLEAGLQRLRLLGTWDVWQWWDNDGTCIDRHSAGMYRSACLNTFPPSIHQSWISTPMQSWCAFLIRPKGWYGVDMLAVCSHMQGCYGVVCLHFDSPMVNSLLGCHGMLQRAMACNHCLSACHSFSDGLGSLCGGCSAAGKKLEGINLASTLFWTQRI